MKNKYTAKEISFLKENYKTLTTKQMSEKLGKSQSSISAKLLDLGLYKKNEPWNDEELLFLKDNYMKMTNGEISEILNRSKNAVRLQGSRMGMKKYPYSCNYHYFDSIDTEEKAYWLGFLVADGWISKNEENNAGVVGIELQYGDIEHLRKFNKSINGNYRITDRWRECLIAKERTKKHHLCIIRIFSLTMLTSLLNLGFTNQKSYDYRIPHIRENLLRHFIRGYFDGDGYLCFTNKTFKVGFDGASKALSDNLFDILTELELTLYRHTVKSEYGTLIFRTNIEREKDKLKFLDYIYKDCNIYLERKYKKYLKVKETYNTTKSLAI